MGGGGVPKNFRMQTMYAHVVLLIFNLFFLVTVFHKFWLQDWDQVDRCRTITNHLLWLLKPNL